MVYGAGLENRYGSNLIVGSNPTPSATTFPVQRPHPATVQSSRDMSGVLSVRPRAPISVFPLRRPLHNRHYYENEPHAPTPSFPRRACPVLDTGREPIPGRCHRSCGNGESRAYFHTLMWPSQGHGDSRAEPAPYLMRGGNPEFAGPAWSKAYQACVVALFGQVCEGLLRGKRLILSLNPEQLPHPLPSRESGQFLGLRFPARRKAGLGAQLS